MKNSPSCLHFIWFASALLFSGLPAARADIFDNLAPHPRLLFPESRVVDLKAKAATDPLLAELLAVVRSEAVAGLDEPTIQRRLDDPSDSEKRMKDERRAAMYRIFNMGVTLRMTDDPVLADQMADRIKAELLAAAQFQDWYPQHFLNIGEMTTLMAVGFDWIYDRLTPAERQIIVEGIKTNGLIVGQTAYNGNAWWERSNSNWNQVINAGQVLAALAVAEEEPALAADILDKATASIQFAMANYVPDGAWDEGPTYWAYGTTYNSLLLAGLRTALDDLQGLESIEGYTAMAETGAFHIQTVGPGNLYFNFGDAKKIAFFSPVLFWLSQEFTRPAYAFYERLLATKDLPRMRGEEDLGLMEEDTLDRFLGLLVVWYDDSGQQVTYDDLPLDQKFRGHAANAAFRGSWTDPDATYLGFKGGYNQAEHGHMDIGTFALDALGERWALDFGGDDYGLPGYFDFGQNDRRWHYLRLNNRGHNTLVINGALQNAHATVPVQTFHSDPDLAYAVIDMSAAYPGQAGSVQRGFAMLDRQRVLVQDRLEGVPDGHPVRWGMNTAAALDIEGGVAVLTLNGKQLEARILEPEGAAFEEQSTHPSTDPNAHANENPNAGTRRLAVVLTAAAGETSGLVILFSPRVSGEAPLPEPAFRPLDVPPPGVPPGARLEAVEAFASAFVRAGSHADTNQMTGEDAQVLRIKEDPSNPEYVRESLIRFPLESLPGKLAGAYLRLYATESGVMHQVGTATGDWLSTEVTFNTRPAVGAYITDTTPLANSFSMIDVSDAVQALIDTSASSATFRLYRTEYNASVLRYASTFHPDANLRPGLWLYVIPEISIQAPSEAAGELGNVPGVFTITRSFAEGSLTVDAVYAGTADRGIDYTVFPDPPRFAGTDSELDVVVTPLTDDMVEGDEDVVLSLSASTDYTVSAPESATLVIKDHPVDAWYIDQGHTAQGGDRDSAGLGADTAPALLRYALGVPAGTNPEHFHPSLQSGTHENQGQLVFTFTRPSPPPPGVAYVPHFSETLHPESWKSVTEPDFSVFPGGARERVEIKIIPGIQNPYFLRLGILRL